ncbi:MAG: acetyl-CoA carboxylase carboxyltransferase subunit alpha [Victivallaceae bacterium]|nr:acetyl-CoA carboxylase carboxyltransferase subunit alpha [Victivallaceae bacterium]
MAEIYLEFEKPIAEIKHKIEEWEALSASGGMDMSNELVLLKKRLADTVAEIFGSLTPWQRVQLARHPERPYTLDYIEAIFTDFVELHGDRRFGDDHAIVGGFAKIDGKKVMVIGTQKGRDVKTNMLRNFGWPHPEGYRKALRLMHIADNAGLPVITMIDTPGAFPGIASEERHIGEAIALNMHDMFSLRVPVISVIIGEGGSGGAIGIGVGNRVLVMENAYYSVITPEGCAAILWKDRRYAETAAEALSLTAQDLLRLGVADEVIPEPPGGAHRDYTAAAANLHAALTRNLGELRQLSGKALMENRYNKFRAMGQIIEPPKQQETANDASAPVDGKTGE